MARAWQLLRWFFEKPPAAGEEQESVRRPRHAPQNLTFLKLKACVVQRRFEAARNMLNQVAADPEADRDGTDIAGRLCEAVADDLRDWDRDGSIWLYEQSLFYFQEYAAWSGTGDGPVGRVEGKLRQVRAADAI